MKKKLAVLIFSVISVSAQASGFSVSSSDIKNGAPLALEFVFSGSGCTGMNKSPALLWTGAPSGTKSFAVTVFDPDAPTGSGWWHWTVVNIPATTTSLVLDAGNINGKHLPSGAVQGRNDFGYSGYGGACPPEGDKPHHYHFTVWALKTEHLPAGNDSSGAAVGYMLNANKIAKTELVMRYSRR